jgi:glycosyltransferase involved in cell wall biosynthesis
VPECKTATDHNNFLNALILAYSLLCAQTVCIYDRVIRLPPYPWAHDVNSPTISAIVPVFKAASYIPDLLKNFSRQSLSDYEILFVNDASPDQARDIISQAANTDPRIRLIEHDSNRGQGATRNSGLDHARGEYVVYIDADDAFTDTYLETLRAACRDNEADIAVCNSIWRFPTRDYPVNTFVAEPYCLKRVLSGTETLRRFYNVFEGDMRIPVEPWGKLIRRDLIERHRLRHLETLFEDVVMTYEEFLLADKVVFINDYGYLYNRTNMAAATFDRQAEYVRQIYRCFEGMLTVTRRRDRMRDMRTLLVRVYFKYIAGVYSFFGKGGVFLSEFWETLETYRTLMPDLNANDIRESEEHIATQLQIFFTEMHSYGWDDLFFLFVEPHRELLEPLLASKGIPAATDI